MKVSIIIPVYNEDKVLANCLQSLKLQTYKPIEIIVVDDGSTDKSTLIAKKFSAKLIIQKHRGPGVARNLGVKRSKGEILVFVDADMIFEKNFVGDLIKPIILKKTIGTFSKNEFISNENNSWSICAQLNKNFPKDRMHPPNYPQTAPVFRAILKSEFQKAGGFDITGDYTDDWSLSEKLKIQSTLASGAIYYHSNPAHLKDAWSSARWIGKNKFLAGTFLRRIKSLLIYNVITSLLIAIYKSILNLNFHFFIYKLLYDFAIFVSVSLSFFKINKYK